MADDKPNQSPESEDESFWDLDAQGVDDILSESAEEDHASTAKPEQVKLASHPEDISHFPELPEEDQDAEGQPQEEQEPSAEEISPAPVTQEKTKQKVSSGERVAQLIVLLALAATFVWLCTYLTTHFDTSDQRDYLANTPVEGEYASIEHIDSWWQAPSGKASLNSKLVPAAEIQLDPSSSKSGALRVVFYSMEKNIDGSAKSAGDSITLTFEDGKFSNGSSSIKVVGTDGLAEMGDFYSYRNQDEKRWTIEIREAARPNSAANDYKVLAQAPIEPHIIE